MFDVLALEHKYHVLMRQVLSLDIEQMLTILLRQSQMIFQRNGFEISRVVHHENLTNVLLFILSVPPQEQLSLKSYLSLVPSTPPSPHLDRVIQTLFSL
jgi:hypothetical protein